MKFRNAFFFFFFIILSSVAFCQSDIDIKVIENDPGSAHKAKYSDEHSISNFNRFQEANEDTLRHFSEPLNSSHNMSVLIEGFESEVFSDRSELACITEDNIIAGAMVLTGEPPWGMAVWGDEQLTEEVEGFVDGEPLRFIYWDAARNWELEIAVTAEDSALVYSANGFVIVNMIVDVNESNYEPAKHFGLISAFPNPFNNTTTITYQLPTPCKIAISLYNVHGRFIGNIKSGVEKAGFHEVNLNAEILNSGVYVIRFRQNEIIQTIKIVLLK